MRNPRRFLIVIIMLLSLAACVREAPAELPAVDFTPPVSTSVQGSPSPLSIPSFIDVNYIDLDQIQRISLFRSSVGHDFSDSYESCRSMKHYFVPYTDLDWSAIKIYSPVDGEILKLTEEWAGTQIQIRPAEYQDYFITIFHVNLKPGLQVGQAVIAGQALGTQISNQTLSDIAVGKSTQEGVRWISYFDVMGDDLFAAYQGRGVPQRSDLIISSEERDTHPLTCEGDRFIDPGNLENYFTLNENRVQ